MVLILSHLGEFCDCTNMIPLQNSKKEKPVNSVVSSNNINSVLQKMTEITDFNDITYVYLLCHGVKGSDDVCLYNPAYPFKQQNQENMLYPDKYILNRLEEIQGDVVFIIESCHSERFVNIAKSKSLPDRITIIASSGIDEISEFDRLYQTNVFGKI